jgi:glycosyltransferase involved in cell wall biosynthesis
VYLLATHIPVYLQAGEPYVEQTWLRDLELARDWLAPKFGPLVVLAPFATSSTMANAEGYNLARVEKDSGINIVPAIPAQCSRKDYWLRHRQLWKGEFIQRVKQLKVVHAGVDDPFRPMQGLTLNLALKHQIPTVCIGPDNDFMESLSAGVQRTLPVKRRLYQQVYIRLMQRNFMDAIRRADLTLLKEGRIFDRYSGSASNPKAFCHTMYSRDDVIDEQTLDERLASLDVSRAFRLVYCGRLIERKGVLDSIDVVKHLRSQGIAATLDIVGSGAQLDEILHKIRLDQLGQWISVSEPVPYDKVIPLLSTYDAMLFTARLDETPRIVFEAFAAGLPVVGSSIEFLAQRAAMGEPVLTAPIGDIPAIAATMERLIANKNETARKSRRARQLGLFHSVEEWYARRAEWTVEAADAKRRHASRKGL